MGQRQQQRQLEILEEQWKAEALEAEESLKALSQHSKSQHSKASSSAVATLAAGSRAGSSPRSRHQATNLQEELAESPAQQLTIPVAPASATTSRTKWSPTTNASSTTTASSSGREGKQSSPDKVDGKVEKELQKGGANMQSKVMMGEDGDDAETDAMSCPFPE